MNENNKLKNYIDKPLISLDEIIEKETRLYTFDINCSKLPSVDCEGENKPLSEIIKSLNKVKESCLYWFETSTVEEANNLINILNKYRDSESQKVRGERRITPTKNNNFKLNPNSKTIYVGKRHEGIRKYDSLTNISGRIVIHFGYYKNGSTQGLQLAHWANEYEGILKLHVLELPNEAKDYLEMLEKLLAKKLNPLCGRH